ncbi:MAG: radical SAM protein [Bacteroidales bacterium]|jgi:radical SAM protein with 4Fe4S-binding SPASM domain|nr:radical SAM protein [Bacteroidales bacterium]
MRYILKDNYILRGWIDNPFGVVDINTGKKYFFTCSEYDVLLHCNGENYINNDSYIKQLYARGFVGIADSNKTITEYQMYKSYKCNNYQTAEIVLTNTCNYKCRHCYISTPNVKKKELSTGEWFNVINQLVETGIFQVELTGGECLLRKDFFQIIDQLIQCNISIVAILSNGSFISSKILYEFEKRGIKPAFQISFDGTEGNHNWLRNSLDAEKKTIRSIKLLRKYGFSVFVTMTMHKGNKDSLRETVLLLGKLDIEQLYVGYVTEMGEWLNQNKTYRMNSSEYYDSFLEYIPYYKTDKMPVNIQLGGIFKYMRHSGKYNIPMKLNKGEIMGRKNVCNISAGKIYITANGSVLPCPIFTGTEVGKNMPNVFSISLNEILTDSNYLQQAKCTYDDLKEGQTQCYKCSFLYECGGKCHVGNWQNERQFLIEKEMSCSFFKGGYETKIQQAWEM